MKSFHGDKGVCSPNEKIINIYLFKIHILTLDFTKITKLTLILNQPNSRVYFYFTIFILFIGKLHMHQLISIWSLSSYFDNFMSLRVMWLGH